MTPDEKRFLEAAITKKFLSENQRVVQMLIEAFGQNMQGSGFTQQAGYNFYLKGGNALAILNGKSLTGDYDFQLMPPENKYYDWEKTIGDINQQLAAVLQKTVEDVAAEVEAMPESRLSFNLECFNVDFLQQWVRDNPYNGKVIDLTGLTQNTRRDSIVFIGKSFMGSSYLDIINSPNFHNGRIEGEDVVFFDQADFQTVGQNFGPSIYVNYTIPGFILYRVVFAFNYLIGGKRIGLKSEIIDVSVPRCGSAEVFMSQEGVVTHFRPSGRDGCLFNIPGWGYHFYENINLIQENLLGISGSPQKLNKRIDRLKQAMDSLEQANKDGGQASLAGLLKIWIKEPANNEPTSKSYTLILGYFGALSFNLDTYGVYDNHAVARLQGAINSRIASYYRIWNSGLLENMQDWKKLTHYRVNFQEDQTLRKVWEVRSCIAQNIRFCPGIDFRKNYQFITPLLDQEEADNKSFPFDYIVIQVLFTYYDVFKNFCKPRFANFEERGDAFTCTINETGPGKRFKRNFSLIVQKAPQQPDGGLPEPPDLRAQVLKRCILESQRYPLAKSLES